MTNEEFSNEFDTLLSSYSVTPPFGEEHSIPIVLDEYEKSVFLTKAQEGVVISLYSGRNPSGESFEETEELRRSLTNLIRTYVTSDKLPDHTGLSKSSVFFKLPPDTWFITYEEVRVDDDNIGCLNGTMLVVVPITQDEYMRIMNNPFRGPNTRRALRLDIEDNVVEIISKYNISEYVVRYLSKPTPIILTDLHEGLSIDGIDVEMECSLNPVLHRTILENAVKLAIMSKSTLRQESK